MSNNTMNRIKNGLVVSCQALEDEPLHGSFIMGRMALAAEQGGAVGIRANTGKDIVEIKKQVDLPIIGIVKRNYADSDIYITPTLVEVDEVVKAGAEIVAVDATDRIRPIGVKLPQFVEAIRQKYPPLLLMADISTVEEAKQAEQLGFDCVSTTLIGYTPYTKGQRLFDHNFQLLRYILQTVNIPVVAEGNILTPEMAKQCLELGVHSVVVGGAITRPQSITKRFVDEMRSARKGIKM